MLFQKAFREHNSKVKYDFFQNTIDQLELNFKTWYKVKFDTIIL